MSLQLYIAGLATFGIMKGQQHYLKIEEHEKAIVDGITNTLESYHYVGKDRKANELRAANAKVFLDSGAFSAWTTGADISIDDYCNYIHRSKDFIRTENNDLMASVLDGIGDPLLTYQNQLAMEARGVRALPCFHYGEDERYLDYYLDNYEYITIGGMVGKSPAQLQIWLDRIFSKHVLRKDGTPRAKLHGFGVTAVPIMERYAWFSVDSSSWVQVTAFGGIMIPGYGKLDVSAESPQNHNAGKHLSNITPKERAAVDELLISQGFPDPEHIYSRYYGRMVYNIWAYQEIERRVNEQKKITEYAPLVMELF